ncbi:MAG: DUF3298 and DUF4163 domain-containing protein [Lachnospiraceae bacterium]|nr:DUF3298 and DUF4163 domain-containing protein [Lachnospiraceae bacterium]
MKKQNRLSILPAAALLTISLSACAAADTSPSGQAASDAFQSGTDEAVKDTAENTDRNDTSVTGKDASDASNVADRIQVTIQKTHEEFKADDGTILLTTDTEMPVVTIEGEEDIAAKINQNIEEYYAGLSSDDFEVLVDWAKPDYEERLANGEAEWFSNYTQDMTVNVTRMDDQVLTYKLTASAYNGGAHGNYGSVAKNYDIATGELIRFEDLAEDISRFHAAALDYMVNLAETPSYKERLFEVTKADLDSALFQTGSWVFTGSGIRFFSDPYVLGPYSSGEIGFTLPYEKAYEIGLKDAYRYTGNFMEERYYTSQYDANMENIPTEGEPEYYFDLNGDGTEEGIAFYGFVYDTESEDGKISLSIDGTDWGNVVRDQINPNGGYLEETYLLYDEDPSDNLTEIAVLFTEFYDDGSDSGITGRNHYTYLFQYTPEKELKFTKRLDGYITNPLPPDTP